MAVVCPWERPAPGISDHELRERLAPPIRREQCFTEQQMVAGHHRASIISRRTSSWLEQQRPAPPRRHSFECLQSHGIRRRAGNQSVTGSISAALAPANLTRGWHLGFMFAVPFVSSVGSALGWERAVATPHSDRSRQRFTPNRQL